MEPYGMLLETERMTAWAPCLVGFCWYCLWRRRSKSVCVHLPPGATPRLKRNSFAMHRS